MLNHDDFLIWISTFPNTNYKLIYTEQHENTFDSWILSPSKFHMTAKIVNVIVFCLLVRTLGCRFMLYSLGKIHICPLHHPTKWNCDYMYVTATKWERVNLYSVSTPELGKHYEIVWIHFDWDSVTVLLLYYYCILCCRWQYGPSTKDK